MIWRICILISGCKVLIWGYLESDIIIKFLFLPISIAFQLFRAATIWSLQKQITCYNDHVDNTACTASNNRAYQAFKWESHLFLGYKVYNIHAEQYSSTVRFWNQFQNKIAYCANSMKLVIFYWKSIWFGSLWNLLF